MKFFKPLKIFKIAFLLFLIFSVLTPNLGGYRVQAETSQEKLDRLAAELKKVKDERANLQSQLNSNTYTISGYNSEVSRLQGEAALYQQDIVTLKIEIEQLETTVAILNNQIDGNQKEIERSEVTIVDLDHESSLRIKSSYMNYRMYGSIDGGNNLLIMDDINSYFKDSQYKEIIQSGTNDLMIKVADLKQLLADKKAELNNQLNEVKRSKEEVDIKKVDLDKKKEDVDIKLAEYYEKVGLLQASANAQKNQIKSLNDSEKDLNAEYLLVLQEIMRTTISTGVFIRAGTIIGYQGNTGYVYPLPSPSNPTAGTHLHFSVYINGVAVDPCGQVQPGDGCGSSGNPLQAPLRGSVTPTQWFKGSAHDGIDIVAIPVQGQPVYAAHDGYVQRGVDCWHRNNGYATNGCANYVKVYSNLGSNAGFVTGYWHLAN